MCNGLELIRFHLDLNALLFSCNRRSMLWVRERFRFSNGPNCRIVLNAIRVDRLDGLTSRTVEIVNLSKRSNGRMDGIGRNVKGPHTPQDRNSECAAIPHGS
ncbi:hypothetical protein M513_10255 [Trichuris suis]|uniref:Uncharacterized protein n=1 Tax=Trichuris suis TaxID=68888 RepID=A0A085LV96_9BILA|nr:hypothetical protein M513_10255 [Trichuris suis]